MHISEKDGILCRLISGENTHETNNRFTYEKNSKIKSCQQKCYHPLYLHKRKHVLSLGFIDILPETETILRAFHWVDQSLYTHRNALYPNGIARNLELLEAIDIDEWEDEVAQDTLQNTPQRTFLKNGENQEAFIAIKLGHFMWQNFAERALEADPNNSTYIATYDTFAAILHTLLDEKIKALNVGRYNLLKPIIKAGVKCELKVWNNDEGIKCENCGLSAANYNTTLNTLSQSLTYNVCHTCNSKIASCVTHDVCPCVISKAESTHYLEIIYRK